jgi:hypothetical protein
MKGFLLSVLLMFTLLTMAQGQQANTENQQQNQS